MRIIGVGQMFNFQTGEVEDRVQIVSGIGNQFTIPTTNEGAALLVKMSMAAREYQTEDESPTYWDQQVRDGEDEDDLAGAEVFGGESEEPSEEQVAMFQHTVEAKAQRQATTSLGIRRNPADRSGVPSMGISRVDERGNPILPEAPGGFDEDEEEDDPGEQI